MMGFKAATLGGFLVFALASPALAFQCPSLMGKVDDALGSASNLSAEQRDEIQALRDDGAAKHASGDHSGSVEALESALEKLGASSGASYSGSTGDRDY